MRRNSTGIGILFWQAPTSHTFTSDLEAFHMCSKHSDPVYKLKVNSGASRFSYFRFDRGRLASARLDGDPSETSHSATRALDIVALPQIECGFHYLG